jgi:rhodanese-related sulfurtransferase
VLIVAPRPITRGDVQRLAAAGALLAEVLPPDEYHEEHLPGAVSLPLKSLTAEAAAQVLEPGRPVVVYCWDAL